jgi:hypothetical protein
MRLLKLLYQHHLLRVCKWYFELVWLAYRWGPPVDQTVYATHIIRDISFAHLMI